MRSVSFSCEEALRLFPTGTVIQKPHDGEVYFTCKSMTTLDNVGEYDTGEAIGKVFRRETVGDVSVRKTHRATVDK